MADEHRASIDSLEDKLAGLEQQARGLKTAINALLELSGAPKRYSKAEISPESAPSLGTMRADLFYGRPLATVVTEYLEMRRAAAQGPATVVDIYDTLKEGGYRFEAKNNDYAKRGLRSSLTKNPKFHKLPNGEYGLTDWYPNLKPSKVATGDNDRDDDDDGGGEEDRSGETDAGQEESTTDES